MNSIKANLMWENNPDTPITANNLSEAIDFQSHGKFIHFTDQSSDYTTWAFHTINEPWPSLTTWDTEDVYINKVIYNFSDNAVKMPIYNPDGLTKTWQTLPTPYMKMLKISAKTKISTYYIDVDSGLPQTLNFNFGNEDQTFTISDLLTEGELDFEDDTKYFVYIYVKHSYNDQAQVKIVKESDDGATFWKTDYATTASPTGNNVISYRKIGGFTTGTGATINESSIWDLSTYKDEIAAESLKIFEDGIPRVIGASDFEVNDTGNIFQSSSDLTVEDALFQNRGLINSLNEKLYTNRRFGLNTQFSHLIPSGSSYTLAGLNEVAIRINPGFIDVLGIQINKEDVTYLADSTVGFKINDGDDLIYDAKLIAVDDLSGHVLVPGVWKIFIDYAGILTLRHTTFSSKMPRFLSQYFGWYDVTGKRCIGQFKVNSDNGNYIEKYSVTDTFDIAAPLNSIHIHYGTLCPDGLLPCDGLWRDVTGVDTNAYTFEDLNNLKPPSSWGDSWYEETPNYTGKAIRGANINFNMISGGPYDPVTGAGGADDYTLVGGNENHIHEYPHDHGSGSLNIVSSGAHPTGHNLEWIQDGESVNVDTVVTGQSVTIGDHTHGVIVEGGDHSHAELLGRTEALTGVDSETQETSSWSPYRDAMICIKKI